VSFRDVVLTDVVPENGRLAAYSALAASRAREPFFGTTMVRQWRTIRVDHAVSRLIAWRWMKGIVQGLGRIHSCLNGFSGAAALARVPAWRLLGHMATIIGNRRPRAISN
jgi:hypothetical protein